MTLIATKNLEKIYDNDGVRTVGLAQATFSIEVGEFWRLWDLRGRENRR